MAQIWKKISSKTIWPNKNSSMTMDAEKSIRHGNIALERRLQETEDSSFVTVLFFSKINLEINLTYKCIKIWSQLNKHLPQWRVQGGGGPGGPLPPPLLPLLGLFFFFTKAKFNSKN